MCDALMELLKDEIAEKERIAAEKASKEANARADEAEAEVKRLKEVIRKLTGKVAVF